MSIKTDAIVIRDETIAGANTATRVGTNLSDIADDLVAKQASIDLKQNKPSEGAFVDGDKTKLDGITAGATPDQVLPTSGVDFDPVGTDNSDDNAVNSLYSGLATSKQDALDVVGQAEAEAGVATTERIWTAERVKQAIDALGGGGGASVSDAAYGISWDGDTTVAPSKNALYDFIESQVFKVDETSNIVPIFWGGTQAEYDIDFPSGHPTNYFVVITDGVVPTTNASDIAVDASGFSSNLSATDTDVQTALGTLDALVSGGGGGVLKEASLIVTNPTIAGGVSVTELLAAPGAGKMIIITSVSMVTTNPTAPTTSVSCHIRYDGHNTEIGGGTAVIGSTPNFNIGFAKTNFFSASVYENRGINAYVTSATDEAVTGKFHFHITYKLFDATTGF